MDSLSQKVVIPWSWDHHGPLNLRVKRTGINLDQRRNTKLLRITKIRQEPGSRGPCSNFVRMTMFAICAYSLLYGVDE